jgi:hypothetical protein
LSRKLDVNVIAYAPMGTETQTITLWQHRD